MMAAMNANDSRFDAAACASTLMHAWTTGPQIAALPPGQRPHTLAEGYAAQDHLFALTGAAHAGWKLGVGSPAQLRANQLERPLVGQLARARCHADGVHLPLPDAAPVTIECEIAFVLAQDLAPDAPHVDVDALIASLCVTFEIVRSRFVDRRAAGWPSFVSDNVGFEALVVGKPLPLARLPEVYDSLRLTLNGAPAAPLLTGDDAIDARAGLRALLVHARQYGITLRRGQIVSTGTMTKPFDLTGTGHTVCAQFLDQTLRFSL